MKSVKKNMKGLFYYDSQVQHIYSSCSKLWGANYLEESNSNQSCDQSLLSPSQRVRESGQSGLSIKMNPDYIRTRNSRLMEILFCSPAFRPVTVRYMRCRVQDLDITTGRAKFKTGG